VVKGPSIPCMSSMSATGDSKLLFHFWPRSPSFVPTHPWQLVLCCLEAWLLKGGALSHSVSPHPFSFIPPFILILWTVSGLGFLCSCSCSFWTFVYTSVLIHVTCPSSRSFQIPFIHDQSVVTSLFWICTTSHLHSCSFLVVTFSLVFKTAVFSI